MNKHDDSWTAALFILNTFFLEPFNPVRDAVLLSALNWHDSAISIYRLSLRGFVFFSLLLSLM